MQNKYSTPYLLLIIVFMMITVTYAAVPLYQLFCQITGYGGTVQTTYLVPEAITQIKTITVHFNSDVAYDMPWEFSPVQSQIDVIPGEPALAFYNATNPTDKPIIGIATYNVTPPQAGLYFNKIQCFCFEEQLLNPKETIEMPVLFFVDPEINNDPGLLDLKHITLSYTFFIKE